MQRVADASLNRNERPVSVTIIGWLYLATGGIGFVYHLTEFMARPSFHYDAVWIELTELLAIVGGLAVLTGRNWGRWVALAWMAFHVVLRASHVSPFAIHLLLCAVIAWTLFRPPAARYFRATRVESA